MTDLKIYLSAPPEFSREAALHGPVSVMAYKIGRGFRLYRTSLPSTRISLMDVDCTGFTGYGPHRSLIAELTGECLRRGYSGMVLDMPRPTPQLAAFVRLLDQEASRLGLSLFLPETYAGTANGSMILLPAQNTSGTYLGRLKRLCSLYGPERLALELERVHTDYPLPARTGRGSIISDPRNIRECSFYSPELCVNYMSYESRGRAHLVLWDDLGSILEKLSQARALGIKTAFLYYPHTADILGNLYDNIS